MAALGGELRHPRVLLRFGWSERFAHGLDFYASSPHLTLAASEWLVNAGVRVLGLDTPSPDDPRNAQGTDVDSPNHQVLLGAGVILLEYLANLDQLTGDEAWIAALPLPLEGADGAPCRVVAVDPAP